jgi:hypothetical protein
MAKRRKKTKSHSMIQKQLQINSRVTSYAPWMIYSLLLCNDLITI